MIRLPENLGRRNIFRISSITNALKDLKYVSERTFKIDNTHKKN